MKKRALVAILAMTMLVGSLAGCNSGGGSSTSSSGSSTPASSEGSSSAEGGETAEAGDPNAEAIAARTEPQTIVVSWMNYTGAPNGTSRIVAGDGRADHPGTEPESSTCRLPTLLPVRSS